MGQAMVGFSNRNDRLPSRGERVAVWVQHHMDMSGVSLCELAFRIKADKRDLRRLLTEASCGHRLEDCLAAYFGWDFVEAVMTPAIGADPITARERELEARRAQAAAIHARLERDRAARSFAPPTGGLGDEQDRTNVVRHPRLGFGQGTPAPEENP